MRFLYKKIFFPIFATVYPTLALQLFVNVSQAPIVDLGFSQAIVLRPFAEYEPVKYVMMSANFLHNSQFLKLNILRHISTTATPVVYATTAEELKIFKSLSKQAGIKNIKYMNLNDKYAQTFWTRDLLPYPVVTTKGIALIDPLRSFNNEPSAVPFSAFLKAPLRTTNHLLQHGNFVANRLGQCATILTNNAPADFFNTDRFALYGCRKTIKLPHLRGIGHVDEVVKFVDDNTVLTSEESYIEILKTEGFNVIVMPTPTPNKNIKKARRTYINSLQVNKKMFVPTFQTPEDQKALSTYESLGFDVIPIPSKYLVDNGEGGLHCISMTYP